MAKMGAPLKINEEIIFQITKAVKNGNYIETASAYVNIDKTTLYDWLRRGRRERDRVRKDGRLRIKKDEQIFVNFSHALEKALAEAEMRDVMIVGKAGETQWQASAWRLERKFPEKWGRHRNVSDLDIEEQKARIRQINATADKMSGEGTDIEDLSEVYGDIYGE